MLSWREMFDKKLDSHIRECDIDTCGSKKSVLLDKDALDEGLEIVCNALMV